MANTYTSLHYHVIFSTKNREPWINRDIEDRVWAYIGGVARKHKMVALEVSSLRVLLNPVRPMGNKSTISLADNSSQIRDP